MIANAFTAGVLMGAIVGMIIGVYIGYQLSIKDEDRNREKVFKKK